MIKIILIAAIAGLPGLFIAAGVKDDLDDSIKRGEQVYATNCMSCHMVDGLGIPSLYPPLVNVDSLLQNVPANINIILKGQQETTVVNGLSYDSGMPSQEYLTDEQIADVLNYIRNSWGNKGDMILPDSVKSERSKTQ